MLLPVSSRQVRLNPRTISADLSVADGRPWELLVRRYQPYLLRIAARYDIDEAAEHAVARTFARLVEQGGSVRGPEAVRCWLALTIRDECLAALRQRRREQPTDPANADALSTPVTVVGRDAVDDLPVEDVHLRLGQTPAIIYQLPFEEEGQSDAVYA